MAWTCKLQNNYDLSYKLIEYINYKLSYTYINEPSMRQDRMPYNLIIFNIFKSNMLCLATILYLFGHTTWPHHIATPHGHTTWPHHMAIWCNGELHAVVNWNAPSTANYIQI